MRHSTGVVILFILCSVHVYTQHPRRESAAAANDFLIDPSKPFVYLELDNIGPSHEYPPVPRWILAAGASKTETGQVTRAPSVGRIRTSICA